MQKNEKIKSLYEIRPLDFNIEPLKGVVDKILEAVANFRGHFWTQWGRLP